MSAREAAISAAGYCKPASVGFDCVKSRIGDPAARFSLVLLGLFIALQILFTVGWILHNDRISRVHAGRRRARPARIRRAEQDFLGRRVAAFPEGVDLTQAPVITIRIEGGMKRMEAGLAFDEAHSALGG